VYVDNVYKGTVDDLERLVTLDVGRRRVDLRARGYETLTFNVDVVADRSIAYRGSLAPILPVVPSAIVPAIPKTLYVIPGCYAGDRLPDSRMLPPGCDAADVRTIPPKV